MRDRLRLYGSRLNRFSFRLFIFIGMMGLYSLALGGADGQLLTGVVLVAALTVGLVVLWFTSRKQRALDRSHQLAAEVSALYPDASAEELDRAYVRHRRREMRLEALWYLLFAVLSAVWFRALYATGASSLTWALGMRTILPTLALIAAGLLVGSFLPLVEEERMPVISEEEKQSTLEVSGWRADYAGETAAALSMAEKDITPERFLKKERRELAGAIALILVAFIFFALAPLVMFAVAYHYQLEYQTFFGFAAFIGVAFWIILCLISHMGPIMAIGIFAQLIRMGSGKCHAYRDTIESHEYREDEGILELHLTRAGTVTLKCSPVNYGKYFAEPKSAAIVQVTSGCIEHIELLPEAADDADDEKLPLSEYKNLMLLDDAYRRQAALIKIEQMTPAQRKAIEGEIESRYDILDQRAGQSYLDLSTVEQGKLLAASSADMSRTTPDPALSGIELALTEKLGVSRMDILRMERNPLMASFWKKLLFTAIVGIGGNLGTAIVAKNTGADLSFAHLVFSIFTGSLAMTCGQALVNALRFRKLQKAYRNPQYRKKLLEAEVYQELREQVKRRRKEAGHL